MAEETVVPQEQTPQKEVTPVAPETPEAPEEITTLMDDDFNYEDISGKAPYEIAVDEPKSDESKPFEEVIAEEVPDEKSLVDQALEGEEPTPEEEPKPPSVEEMLATQRKEMEEQFSKQQEESTKKIVESLTGKKEDDKFFVKPPWEVEKRQPKDYTELGEWIMQEQVARGKHSKEQADIKTKAATEQQQKDTAEQDTKLRDQWNKSWDEQYSNLIKEDKIPAFSTEAQTLLNSGKLPINYTAEEKLVIQNDAGVKAYQDLLALSYLETKKAKESGSDTLAPLNLEFVYYKHYEPRLKKGRKQPPGEKAPISLGRGKMAGLGDEEFFYDEIHNKKPWQIK